MEFHATMLAQPQWRRFDYARKHKRVLFEFYLTTGAAQINLILVSYKVSNYFQGFFGTKEVQFVASDVI